MSYIEEAIKTATTGECHRFQGDADHERESMLAELARLRAEAEAWQAVRKRFEENTDGTNSELTSEGADELSLMILAQIARLAQPAREA